MLLASDGLWDELSGRAALKLACDKSPAGAGARTHRRLETLSLSLSRLDMTSHRNESHTSVHLSSSSSSRLCRPVP